MDGEGKMSDEIICCVENCEIKGVIKIKGKWYCPYHLESRVDYLKHIGVLK